MKRGPVESMRTAVEHQLRTLQVPAGSLMLVAVSGGQDSVCLLDCLHEASPRLGYGLVIVHLNHCLRGEESEADGAYVRELATGLGVEMVEERVDVASYARQHRLGLELAGRLLRY